MMAFFNYMVQASLCSAVLFLYYRCFLFNRSCHRWNRGFLLLSVLASLILPLISLPVYLQSGVNRLEIIQILDTEVVSNYHEPDTVSKASPNWSALLVFVYCATTFVLLTVVFRNIFDVIRSVRKGVAEKKGGLILVRTKQAGTPYSFLKYIFVDPALDMNGDCGKKIWIHEQTHAREFHSVDRLFINIIVALFWWNPLFWLIRRELELVHEFIADKKAFGEDVSAFSSLILANAYPGHSFQIVSNLYSKPIKRRLTMLKKISQKNHFFLRFLSLAIVGASFFAFTKRTPFVPEDGSPSSASRPITVMLDAGHGGDEPGAKSEDGVAEKDLNLQLTNSIAAMNSDKNIRIITTRSDDRYVTLRDRVEMAKKNNVDIYLSVHVNNSPVVDGKEVDSEPFSIFVSRKDNAYADKTKLIGSLVLGELKTIHAVNEILKSRTNQGIWVLDAPEITYPSLLVQFGNIRSKEDVQFITSKEGQNKIAQSVLKAIKKFSSSSK